jgi:TonB family protein
MPRIPIVFLAIALMLAAQDDKIYKVTEPGLTQPSILRKVEPKYPKKTAKKKIAGTVKLTIVISAEGRAEDDVKIEKSLDPDLDESAIIAVKQWVFKPAMKDGAPVRVYATILVTFHLTNP